MTYEPSLFDLEDKGYGRGVGTFLLPDGKQLSIHHEQDDLATVLIQQAFRTYYVQETPPNDFL